MDKDIKVFDNLEFGQIRTVIINEIPYFVGRDVADILGYSNPRKAMSDHVDEEDKTYGVTIRDSIGRKQNPILINESGLYSLILSSKLPKAKSFKRWVTSEVLPSIRKTGSYVIVKAFKDLENRIKKIESKTVINVPKRYSVGINTSEIAFSLGITPKKLFRFLMTAGIVYKNWDKYELHDDYVGFGYIQRIRSSYELCNGRQVKYWTLKGVRFVIDLYNNVNSKEEINVN